MGGSDRGSLAKRTVTHVMVFAAGSIALVGLLSVLLVAIARAVLPSREVGDGSEEAAAKADDGAPRRRARPSRSVADEAPRKVGRPSRPETEAPTSDEKTRPPWSACCTALEQNAKSAPPEQKAVYTAAAAACRDLTGTADARRALVSMLEDAAIPSACR